MRRLARLQAVFLTLVFLGGGTGVPGLDVLLFHLQGEESGSTAHIEQANGCAAHVGHCAAGLAASAASALSAASPTTPVAPATLQALQPLVSQVTPLIQAVGFQSRAPPAGHV